MEGMPVEDLFKDTITVIMGHDRLQMILMEPNANYAKADFTEFSTPLQKSMLAGS